MLHLSSHHGAQWLLKVMDWIGMLWLWTIRRMCNCVCVFLSLPLYHQFVTTIMCLCLRVACCLVLFVSVLSRFASRVACKILLSALLCMNAHKHPHRHGFQRENRIRPSSTKEHERKSRHLQKQHASKRASEQNKTPTKQAIKRENGESMEKR